MKKDIDWSSLGFGYIKTDYRYISNFKDGTWDEGVLSTDDTVTISESAGVIDEKSLRTWDSEDVLAVYDSLVRAHESINKLALVPESF